MNNAAIIPLIYKASSSVVTKQSISFKGRITFICSHTFSTDVGSSWSFFRCFLQLITSDIGFEKLDLIKQFLTASFLIKFTEEEIH